ncbi:hypothetical protein MAPG_10637 [Magnaporthiopsis poae ATCC 64411]|uniref:Uncharacterized protein n=1 Tax=Magnaporthiopsis poae (strain ATCC 64411 / 73-15) TaxID=644358 RepID=A0A0C4ED44_MAGP6|nr:hypothetical protein MAPG_10637 [Magnaporthiopsis poae ATCC 64411]
MNRKLIHKANKTPRSGGGDPLDLSPSPEPTVRCIEIADNGSLHIFDADLAAIAASSKLNNSSTPPGLAAKLFVVNGDRSLMDRLAAWTAQDGPDPEHGGPLVSIPRDFVRAHLDNEEKTQREFCEAAVTETADVYFFASWWRTEAQNLQQYQIRQRILTRRPYSIGTPATP